MKDDTLRRIKALIRSAGPTRLSAITGVSRRTLHYIIEGKKPSRLVRERLERELQP